MTRSGLCAAGTLALASLLSAQAPAAVAPRAAAMPALHPAHTAGKAAAPRPAAIPPSTFQKYCFECHGTKKPEAGLSIQKLVSGFSIGAHWQQWEKVAEMLETGVMPPLDADEQPTDAERTAAAAWIRDSLTSYESDHAGEPGPVTVRRLTSAEYAYALRDLTGIDVKSGIDTSNDSVGGEGFANFGDVQFVQDENIERYLEAAKLVADHAVIGAGPLEFYADPGKTGLELSALNRINELYSNKGFRVVSGEGGGPFGLERYGKALYVAWYYKHRVALGDPKATIRGLAAKEGITGRFADHIWGVVNKPNTAYPTRETVDRWTKLPAPTADIPASVAKGRAGCDQIQQFLTTWPSWFFARGDLAAGGAGDESPLAFTDETLKVDPTRRFTYGIGVRGGRGRGGPSTPGPQKVYLIFNDVAPGASTNPVIIWRNPRIVTRAVPAGRGAPGPGVTGLTPVAPAASTSAGSVTAVATPAVAAQGAGRGAAGPVLSTTSLRALLSPETASSLAFGTSPDGTALGPDDFATTGTVSFTVDVPQSGHVLEFHADAELGKDRNAVVRVMLSERPEGTSRDALQRVMFGDPKSTGYEKFRANMAEYVSLLPPNSHGEANPADKDPVPTPFDNTYNSPEHDAFVLKVKYQRSDRFFTENMVDGADRDRLNQAWNDLFGSWPYHDAYLGMLIDHYGLTLKSRRIDDLAAAQIATQPAAARPYLTALRAHYDEVRKTEALAAPGHLTDALTFASRAWRRPLTATEKTSLRAFYQKSRALHQLDHDGAMRAVIARVLVSPAFLYRVETVSRGPEKALDGYELASRLSFFLWSSIPDDELRRAAAAGELSTPAQLAKQVKRMTADPKARRLSTEFFGQWLGFYHFDQYRGVDTGRFPEFTDQVRTAMYDEAVSTFEYIVRQNRPVKEILFADYTFLNKPLAKFYGLQQDVKSEDTVVKVEGANAFNRGGALRLGSVLTTTSAPLRTSPVKRGDWVLRRVLGAPTPPPPADAGTLPGDDKSFNGLTLRQRLTEHKRNATCAACHLRIDPLGFPLEGFDAVGRSRAKYADGQAVDDTGELADKKTIAGASGLLEYLQGKDKQVMTTLSRKMLGYALGRTVLASDRPLIGAMTAAGMTASFSDLALEIVTSRQFRYRTGDGSAAGAAPTTTTSNARRQFEPTAGTR
jgi:mono/diheme cytochrome c family protein